MSDLSFVDKNLHFTGERMIPEESHYTTFWEHIYRYRFAKKYIRGKQVLDIACGEGYGTAALVNAGALSVVGIDISPETCEHARKKYGIDTRVGDALNIPLPTDSVDVIVSFETIEHLSDPGKFLEECIRLLKPNGRLIISTPNKDVYNKQNPNNTFHIREFQSDEFVGLLKKYFSKVTLYSQEPQSIAWTNWRFLISSASPWLRLKGMYRLRKALLQFTCPAFKNMDLYKNKAIELVLLKDHFLSYFVNPYLVVRSTGAEKPIYLVAIADLKT